MAIRFLYTPKSKQFKLKPRYYNEQKEDLENRVRSIKRKMGVDELKDSDKPYVPNIKGQMRGYYKKNSEQKKQSTVRLIVIMVILLTATYFLLFF
ncbi:MAG: hypothetical protein PF485_04705 [Bacteroidales bacterium]|jgi:hypothetical protein|nr:hypothetical protein [Bacteroidales bacterium]